jgi:hypothetical protein
VLLQVLSLMFRAGQRCGPRDHTQAPRTPDGVRGFSRAVIALRPRTPDGVRGLFMRGDCSPRPAAVRPGATALPSYLVGLPSRLPRCTNHIANSKWDHLVSLPGR